MKGEEDKVMGVIFLAEGRRRGDLRRHKKKMVGRKRRGLGGNVFTFQHSQSPRGQKEKGGASADGNLWFDFGSPWPVVGRRGSLSVFLSPPPAVQRNSLRPRELVEGDRQKSRRLHSSAVRVTSWRSVLSGI